MSRRIITNLLLSILFQLLILPGVAKAQFLKSPYFEKIKSGEPLVVALTQNTPPFCLRDENGEPDGIDVELARLLGKTLNVEIQFVYPEFKDIFGLIEEGAVDLAIANIAITVERAQHVTFSHGYMDITQGAILDRRFIPRQIVEGEVMDVPIHSYADLAKIPGLVVGTWGNTTSAELDKSFHLDLEQIAYPNILAAREALREGEINALAADSPIIEFIANYYRGSSKRFKTLTKPTAMARLAIAIRMGDPAFAEFLNEFVDESRANGTMDRLIENYIEDTSWARKVLR